MKYPKLLQKGDVIGICAPSSGVAENLFPRLDNVKANINALGYETWETQSVRSSKKCVSADAETRAREFLSLYENPTVSAIIPPWGGEFLMEILPLLDFEKISGLPPKWISGYSDITTLTFPFTLLCDIATIHGSSAMNMGGLHIDESDLVVFDVLSKFEMTQKSFPFYSRNWPDFADPTKDTYDLSLPSKWKLLRGDAARIQGRIIGGCMDTLNILVGTKYANISPFLEKYKSDGIIWTLESCEMSAGEIYRALWQMRENGWFQYCSGVMIGRPEGYADTNDFTLIDALECGLGNLNVPVMYDVDIGHIPPILQLVNGALGIVEYSNSQGILTTKMTV